VRPRYVVRRALFEELALLEAHRDIWSRADTLTWGASPFTTRFRALWSDHGLYLRFDVADRHPWHTFTGRDARLWEEEVVEIFLDPTGGGVNYAELEINPANVVCDLIVRRPWPNLDSDPAWHIRGLATHVLPWREPEAGPDGWTATARLPWNGLSPVTDGVRVPPQSMDVWRFNVFRIKRPGGPARPRDNVLLSAWSPTGGPSFHVPQVFGEMVFA
jgi:hypothetical protein